MKLTSRILIVCIFFSVTALFSCQKDNTITPPSPFSEIATLGASDTTGTYIIKSNNMPYKIPIGISNVSDQDRTLQISYSSPTAVEGIQYKGPTSIVIPAGTSVDSLAITGIYDGFETVTRVDVLTITISGGDVPSRGQKSTYVLKLKKYWEAPTDIFQGTYVIQDYADGDPDGGPYTVLLKLVSANGPTLNMQVIGLWGSNVPLNFTMNWIDLEHGTTTVPTQKWDEIGSYGVSTVKTVGTGTFTVDPEKLTISYNPTVAAGSFGNYKSVMNP